MCSTMPIEQGVQHGAYDTVLQDNFFFSGQFTLFWRELWYVANYAFFVLFLKSKTCVCAILLRFSISVNYSLKLSLPEMCYIFAAIKIMYWLWTWLQRDFLFFVPFVGRFEAFMHSLALSAPPSRGQGQPLFFDQSTNHCVFLSPSPTRKYQNNCMEKYIMNTVRQTMHAENILSSLSGKYWF